MLVLHPDVKMNYFCKHWDKDLQAAVLRSAEEIVGLLVIQLFVLTGIVQEKIL